MSCKNPDFASLHRPADMFIVTTILPCPKPSILGTTVEGTTEDGSIILIYFLHRLLKITIISETHS